MLVSEHLKNYLIKRNLLVSIVEISGYLLRICIKHILMLSQTLWMIYLKKMKYHITLGKIVIYSRKIKSVYHGSETISYLGPKIWNLVPNNFKDLWENNISFNAKIKFWKPESYPYRLCKVYLNSNWFYRFQILF